MDGPVETLERWERFGGHWRVLELTDRHAAVELCACTGERIDRLESGDAALIAYLRSERPGRPAPPTA